MWFSVQMWGWYQSFNLLLVKKFFPKCQSIPLSGVSTDMDRCISELHLYSMPCYPLATECLTENCFKHAISDRLSGSQPTRNHCGPTFNGSSVEFFKCGCKGRLARCKCLKASVKCIAICQHEHEECTSINQMALKWNTIFSHSYKFILNNQLSILTLIMKSLCIIAGSWILCECLIVKETKMTLFSHNCICFLDNIMTFVLILWSGQFILFSVTIKRYV